MAGTIALPPTSMKTLSALIRSAPTAISRGEMKRACA